MTWFIGRTRAENCPCGTLDDRFREPVIRNDYVALIQQDIAGSETPLTDTNGDEIRVVHIDGNAAGGGDGTFENPFNSLDDVSGTQEGDILLAHADSTIGGGVTLLDDQTFVGEGGGNAFQITTTEQGVINLPETDTDSLNGVIPMLTGTAGATVTLADDNLVQNLDFTGGVNAIVSDALLGSNNPTMQMLTISNTTSDAIMLAAFDGADVDDVDNDGNVVETLNILGTVTIDDVRFTDVIGADINIDATSSADMIANDNINISNINTTRTAVGTGPFSLVVDNTNSTGTTDIVTIDNYTFNGTMGGAMSLDSNQGSVSIINSSVTGGVGPALSVTNTNGLTDQGTVSFGSGSNSAITDVAGTAVSINGTTGAVTVGANLITNTGVSGGGVSVVNNMAAVDFNGDIGAIDNTAVFISGAEASVNFAASGDITHDGTGSAVFITDAADVTTDSGDVTFSGTITNMSGSLATIIDGDDEVLFVGVVDDMGSGITINNRDANSRVSFGAQTTLATTTNNGVTLSGNDATSILDFVELDITTTSGTGIQSDGGEINITGTDSTITTTAGGQALDIVGGSSTMGLTFSSIEVSGGGTNGINLNGFDGTVTVNDGSITTNGDAVTVVDTNLALTDVDINAGAGNDAINAMFTDTTLRLLSYTSSDALTPVNANNGDFVINSSGDGAIVTITDVVNAGDVSYLSSGSGPNTLTMSDVTTSGGFDFDIGAGGTGDLTTTLTNVEASGATTIDNAGDGTLDVNMTNVQTGGSLSATAAAGANGDVMVDINNAANTTTNQFTTFDFNAEGGGEVTATISNVDSNGAATLDVTSSGSGSLTMSNVEAGGVLTANSSGGSSGALTVNVSNSGTTSNFTDVTVNDQGDGAVTATFTNVTSTSGVDFDSAGNGNASLSVSGGTYGGEVNVNATNNGTLTANVTGSTDINGGGGVVINAGNTGTFTSALTGVTAEAGATVTATNGGTATVTVSGGSYEGDINVNATNGGNLIADVIGSTDINGGGGISITAGNTGTFSTNLSGVTADAGVTINSTSTSNASMNFNGGTYGGAVDIDANNTGTFTFDMTNITATTGNNDVGFALLTGTGVTTGGIDIANSNFTTLDARAFDFDVNGGDLNFLLNNNSFNNASNTNDTTVIDIAGTSELDATIQNNTFANGNVAIGPVEFLIETSANTPTLNLLIEANTANRGGGNGNGTFEITETAGTIGVFELNDTFNNVGNRNNGTVNFDPNNIGDFDDLPAEPGLP